MAVNLGRCGGGKWRTEKPFISTFVLVVGGLQMDTEKGGGGGGGITPDFEGKIDIWRTKLRGNELFNT